MKLQRKYILQYLCILVLAAIGVMNIIEADYLRALTSAIYVFICVQVVVAKGSMKGSSGKSTQAITVQGWFAQKLSTSNSFKGYNMTLDTGF